MELYGYIALSEKTKDGFVMPIFQKEDKTLCFQRIEMDKTISLVTLDLERDIYAPIRECKKAINVDLKEEVLAYLDDGEVYIGDKYYIYDMAKNLNHMKNIKSRLMI